MFKMYNKVEVGRKGGRVTFDNTFKEADKSNSNLPL